MILMQTKTDFSLSNLESLSRALRESPAAKAQRAHGWRLFDALPIPAKEDEAWRRTPLARFDLNRFEPSLAPLAHDTSYAARVENVLEDQEGLLLLQDDQFYRRLGGEWEARGLIFKDLSSALRENTALVEKYLGGVPGATLGKFDALNRAFWNRGVFVYVPKGMDVTLPLLGGHAATARDGAAVLPRTIVVLEEGARLTYFDDYVSSGLDAGQALSCGSVEIHLGADADLRYVNVQRWGRGMWHFFSQDATLGRDARLTALSISLGGSFSKVDLGSRLMGQGAVSKLYGLVFGDENQHFTHHTLQDHTAPNTQSDLLFKAAVKDKARSVYTGLIHITKEAQRTSAFQTSRNMLLSDTAKADTIPMLEILADDVQCGHGASVGALDEDQRFYLMTRGLDRQNAERVIVEGFFEEVLQRVPLEGAREKLHAAINQKLGVA